jgi:uncharacterized protein (TIGR02594 family)
MTAALSRAHQYAPWLETALLELGTHEKRNEARVRAYHGVTAAGEAPGSVYWCSSFVCWVFEQHQIAHTRSKRARSYEIWGELADVVELWPGSVVVFPRGDGGHVGFALHASDRWVWVLGGNQGNAVSVQRWPRASLITARWPKGWPMPSDGSAGIA